MRCQLPLLLLGFLFLFLFFVLFFVCEDRFCTDQGTGEDSECFSIITPSLLCAHAGGDCSGQQHASRIRPRTFQDANCRSSTKNPAEHIDSLECSRFLKQAPGNAPRCCNTNQIHLQNQLEERQGSADAEKHSVVLLGSLYSIYNAGLKSNYPSVSWSLDNQRRPGFLSLLMDPVIEHSTNISLTL